MRIIEFGDKDQKDEWNDFVIRHSGSFLQSWEWGEIAKARGRKIWRLGVQTEDGRISMAALIIKHDLPFGKSYLYIPRGPSFVNTSESRPVFTEATAGKPINSFLWQNFLYQIREIAGLENAIFLEIEPQISRDNSELSRSFEELGLKRTDFCIQPRKTLILDLSKSEKELLQKMHPKTRYNIRLAQRKGIKVRGWPGESALERFESFFKLSEETAGRDRIRLFPKSHYRHVFEILGRSGLCELYAAEYGDKILAVILVVFWAKTAIYLYGASSSKYQNLMPSSLIQWEAILDTKIKGLKFYDFWGIDDKKWPGITRFKKGFGGREVEYSGAWDYVFKPGWYRIYRVAKRLLGK